MPENLDHVVREAVGQSFSAFISNLRSVQDLQSPAAAGVPSAKEDGYDGLNQDPDGDPELGPSGIYEGPTNAIPANGPIIALPPVATRQPDTGRLVGLTPATSTTPQQGSSNTDQYTHPQWQFMRPGFDMGYQTHPSPVTNPGGETSFLSNPPFTSVFDSSLENQFHYLNSHTQFNTDDPQDFPTPNLPALGEELGFPPAAHITYTMGQCPDQGPGNGSDRLRG